MTALTVFCSALFAQAEDKNSSSGEEKDLPRVFNYNRNVQLFRVDPQVNVPDSKPNPLEKYELDERTGQKSFLERDPIVPLLPRTQLPNRPQTPSDVKPDNKKNWLTPSAWQDRESTPSREEYQLTPDPAEELEAIRRLFAPDEDLSDGSDEKPFLSYIQNQQEVDAQKEEDPDEDPLARFEDDQDNGLFNRDEEPSMRFEPSVSLYTNEGDQEDAAGKENAELENSYQPAVEKLNPRNAPAEELEAEAITVSAMDQILNQDSNADTTTLRSQAMLTDITSKWMNIQSVNRLPTMKEQLNTVSAPSAPRMELPAAPPPPKLSASTPSAFAPVTAAPSVTAAPTTSPSFNPRASLNTPSFSDPGNALTQPSSFTQRSFTYQPQRTTANQNTLRNPTPTTTITGKNNLREPTRMRSGLGNTLPGVSGFGDPMR